ncbi:MAG: hypothetical protein FWC34_03890 [Bacteroidetes bacterium]|nr:hypothetical protein [Bacteroidota bacterium]MCL2303403.1 hypothetical protein [Lentimicrobiaceae bacterium]
MKKIILLFFFSAFFFGVNAQNSSSSWELSGNANTSSRNFLGTTDCRPLIFKTRNIERMRLLSDRSFLGIGVSDPQVPLHVHYQTDPISCSSSKIPSISGLMALTTSNLGSFHILMSNSSHAKAIYLSQSEETQLIIGRVDASTILQGKIGVGTWSPQQKLHIKDGNMLISKTFSGTYNGAILFTDTGDEDPFEHPLWSIQYLNNGLNFDRRAPYVAWPPPPPYLFIADNGNVGLANNNPQAKLDVNGSFRATSANITDTLTANTLRATGALSAQSASIIGTTHLNGNVGIGIAPGQERLNVNGSFRATSANITNTLTAGTLTSNGALNAQTANITGTATANALSAQSAKIDGLLCAKEIRVSLSGAPCWPDFVFGKDYKLPTLSEVEQFIAENQHLPNIPSAAEVEANGIELGEMNVLLLQKVEELTLYIIQMEKRLSELENKKGGE